MSTYCTQIVALEINQQRFGDMLVETCNGRKERQHVAYKHFIIIITIIIIIIIIIIMQSN